MKRLLPVSFFLLALFLAGSAAEAQISINESQMQGILLNSKRMNYYMGYGTPPTIDLGSPMGSSQTFDFSVLSGETEKDSLHQEFVDPTGQPGATEFPTANLCSPEVIIDTSLGAELSLVSYFRLQSDGFYILGFYSKVSFPPFPDQITIERHNPPQLLIPLPLAYGTSRTVVDTGVSDASPDDYTVTTTTVACDGWGDVTFPAVLGIQGAPKSALVQCLRATQTTVEEDYASGSFVDRRKSVAVVYITADGTLLSVEQADTAYTGGNASVVAVDYSMRVGTSDVRQVSPLLPEGFALTQNYPNPFNPSTTIGFSVPASGRVTLRVYDLLGREVSTLVDGQLAPGSYEATFDAAGLPSGMYVYRLVSGTYTETRKMNVLK
jgi:hypothetical protein